MAKLVLVTVGFDVNLVLRSLLKIGLGEGDCVLLVYSRSGGEYEQRRVEETVKTLKTILAGVRVEHYDAIVTGMDFVSDVAVVLKALKEHGKKVIVASLVGGMRIVIVEALVALALYERFIDTDAEVSVHVMREDGVYDTVVPLSALNLPDLGPRELAVLEEIGRRFESRPRNEIANVLSREMSITESMAYKALESLEEKGFIRFRDSVAEITTLGKLLLTVHTVAKEVDEAIRKD